MRNPIMYNDGTCPTDLKRKDTTDIDRCDFYLQPLLESDIEGNRNWLPTWGTWQELITHLGHPALITHLWHLAGTDYSSEAPLFTPSVCEPSICESLVNYIVFCILCCLYFLLFLLLLLVIVLSFTLYECLLLLVIVFHPIRVLITSFVSLIFFLGIN